MELQYRQATINDIKALQALSIASYGEFSSQLTTEYWSELNNTLHDEEKLKTLIELSTVFVCVAEERIVGMIYFVSNGNPTELFQEDWSYIRMLGVDPSYRGHGIGKELTNLCIEEAKNTKEEFIALHTSEFMDSARHIYETMGFEQVKTFINLGKKYWIYLLKL